MNLEQILCRFKKQFLFSRLFFLILEITSSISELHFDFWKWFYLYWNWVFLFQFISPNFCTVLSQDKTEPMRGSESLAVISRWVDMGSFELFIWTDYPVAIARKNSVANLAFRYQQCLSPLASWEGRKDAVIQLGGFGGRADLGPGAVSCSTCSAAILTQP